MEQLSRIVETCLYVDDLQAAERFYTEVLELERIGGKPDRHVFFRVGDQSVLILFRAEATRNDAKTPHGATGAGHMAFGVGVEKLGEWRARVVAAGVSIEEDAEWPKGGRSFYFRDPAGNLLEMVTPGIWGLPSGW